LTGGRSATISPANVAGRLCCPPFPFLKQFQEKWEPVFRPELRKNRLYRRHLMANTTSAKKATRKIARRTEVNRNRLSRLRTFVRKVEEALASGDKKAATEAFQAAQPELMRAAGHGVIHKNTASRKISRLAARVKAVGA
jgi:small subunit ribosomal protein S20